MCYSPNYIAYTAQVLDFSFCVQQNTSPIWSLLVNSAQITLGALICLLVVIQFIKEALQMYNATKHFHLNRYMNLLVREGMIYFLAYVHISFHFSFHATKLIANYYE